MKTPCSNASALAALLAATSGFTIAAPAETDTKILAFAWEFSGKSVRDLPAVVDSLDATPIDGIGVYLNEPQANGTKLSTHNVMHEAWRRETLEPLVPLARELTAHRSMRESFIGTFRAPLKRINWHDDYAWARIASNMAIAAWFAREGGFRGLSMDPEDYPGTGQFRRRPDDPPYDALRDAARRRGREVFEGVFREYPDIRILSFWLLSMGQRGFGMGDLADAARENGDLWPSFVDGILDVLPPTARLIDGCEHAYRYESARGDFWRAGDAIRRRLPALLAPENRAKYAAQVGASFGIYLDMFTNPEGSSWFAGPVDGSRLRHLERNVFQASEAADGYVWLWGEKHCLGDWGAEGPDAKRGISQQPWGEALPGLEDVLLAIKDPAVYAARREAALRAEGRWTTLNANPECGGDAEDVPAPYAPWQHAKSRQGRLWRDETCGEGDTSCLAAEGCENGAFSVNVAQPLLAGDRLLVRASMRGDGGSAQFCWKRADGAWDWDVLQPVRLRFGPPGADGWRRGEAVVRVPEGAARAGLILSVRQIPGEICRFDNVEIHALGCDVNHEIHETHEKSPASNHPRSAANGGPGEK